MPRGRASLSMYPFAELRPATEGLLAALTAHLHTDVALDPWSMPYDARWTDPDLLISQTCGYPLVTRLADQVRLLGAFSYATAVSDGYRYRSVIVAATAAAAVTPQAGAVAAANQPDSLSGWISLLSYAGGAWPGSVRWTGSHAASIDAVRVGRADIASIDAVTWALLVHHHPARCAGLHVVGRGPLVPTLPLITSGAATDEDVAALRRALHVAAASGAARQLMIDGFAELSLDDYRPVAGLVPHPG